MCTLSRVKLPVCISLTKTSEYPFVSPATRLLAWLVKVTRRPSPEIAPPAAVSELPLPRVPSVASLASVTAPVCMSLTKTSS